jgi:Dyp-type peroxidase family
VLDGFSFPFREGMTEDHRRRVLGDIGDNAPQNWMWGAPEQDRIDVLLLVYAAGKAELKEIVSQLCGGFAASGLWLVARLAFAQLNEHEHFGFRDGISQPSIEGPEPFHSLAERARAKSGDAGMLKAGEIILGYEDETGRIAPVSTLMVGGQSTDNQAAAGFARNGSYLVFRHLAQNVGLLRSFLTQATLDTTGSPDLCAAEFLAAKMVGRWQEGVPLAMGADRKESPSFANAFSYSDDPGGLKCPVGAHIRRANPRDSLDASDPAGALERVRRRRLLRRGRSFGEPLPPGAPDDGAERGLYFICLCADLERQFEFVQQTWLNNQSFSGLRGETDPLIGARAGTSCFTVPGAEVPTRYSNLGQFVTVRGGAYFFLPGIHALQQLVSGRF